MPPTKRKRRDGAFWQRELRAITADALAAREVPLDAAVAALAANATPDREKSLAESLAAAEQAARTAPAPIEVAACNDKPSTGRRLAPPGDEERAAGAREFRAAYGLDGDFPAALESWCNAGGTERVSRPSHRDASRLIEVRHRLRERGASREEIAVVEDILSATTDPEAADLARTFGSVFKALDEARRVLAARAPLRTIPDPVAALLIAREVLAKVHAPSPAESRGRGRPKGTRTRAQRDKLVEILTRYEIPPSEIERILSAKGYPRSAASTLSINGAVARMDPKRQLPNSPTARNRNRKPRP